MATTISKHAKSVSMSETLERALQRQTVQQDSPDGIVAIQMPWRPPERIPPSLIVEAKAVHQVYLTRCEPAPKELLKAWLSKLGILVTNSMTASDAKAKLAGYASLMEFPETCLTKETLEEAARQFKWFPNYAELCDFFEEKARDDRERCDALEWLANAIPTDDDSDLEASPACAHWQACRPKMIDRFGESEVRKWLDILIVGSDDGETIELWGESKFIIGYVGEHFQEGIEHILDRHVRIVVRNRINIGIEKRIAREKAERQAHAKHV